MTMNHTLKFLRTFTLDEFKEWKGILQIRIIRNVLSEESGEQFLLLHNAGDNPQFTTVAVL